MVRLIGIKGTNRHTGSNAATIMQYFNINFGSDPDFILAYSEIRASEMRKRQGVKVLKRKGLI